jgi:hypothetical protein
MTFHAEGLKFSNIRDKLLETVKGLPFRPVVCPITPFCPAYHVYPFTDPLRTQVEAVHPTNDDIRRFGTALHRLSEYADIGYHGHYFSGNNGRMEASFEPWAFASQFNAEVQLLSNLGFRPKVYVGGHWFMSKELASMLDIAGFEVDTTVTDVKRDSFGRLQYGSDLKFGRPEHLWRNVTEFQTRRRVRIDSLFNGARDFYCYSLHDYDLLNPDPKAQIRNKLMLTLMSRTSTKSMAEMLERSVVVA